MSNVIFEKNRGGSAHVPSPFHWHNTLKRSVIGAYFSGSLLVLAQGATGSAGTGGVGSPVTPNAPATNQTPADVPTPMATPQKTKAAAQKPSPNNSQSGGNLMGPVRAGLAFGLSVPHMLEYGLEVKALQIVGASFYMGNFSRVGDSKSWVEGTSWALRGEWFPFLGSFYLGLGYGQQTYRIRGNTEISFVDTATKLSVKQDLKGLITVKNSYITPQLGWVTMWGQGVPWGGFLLVSEIGVMINSGFKTSTSFEDIDTSGQDISKYRDDLESDLNKYASYLKYLPFLTIKVGWAF